MEPTYNRMATTIMAPEREEGLGQDGEMSWLGKRGQWLGKRQSKDKERWRHIMGEAFAQQWDDTG